MSRPTSPTPAGSTSRPFGEALRDWRRHRGLSQLELSLEAEVSARHLSFLETGRSNPSREMVLRLLETLEVPLWDRNRLIQAAGYAPVYSESSFHDTRLDRVRQMVQTLVERHEPYPAYAMDGTWTVHEMNRSFRSSLDRFENLSSDSVNILRLICSPELLRPHVVNWQEVAGAVFRRVRRQLSTPEPPADLAAVVADVRAYPGVDELLRCGAVPRPEGFLVPLKIESDGTVLSWMTTILTIGGALDVTLDQLVIECFFPADDFTERYAQTVDSL